MLPILKYAEIHCDHYCGVGQSTRPSGIAKRNSLNTFRRDCHNGNAIIALNGDKFAGSVYWGVGAWKICSTTQAYRTILNYRIKGPWAKQN